MSTRKARSVRRSEQRRRIMPPLRDGINASPMRLPEDAAGEHLTVGDWLTARFGAEAAHGLLERGDVLAGQGVVVTADWPYLAGERLWLFRPVLDEPAEPIVLDVVAENERYLVIHKPHGISTAPKGSHVAGSALVAARRQFGNDLLVPAHRLDLETAGLLLLVKEPQWRGAYQKLFERRRIRKSYRAVAPLIAGAVPAREGQSWHSELMLYKKDGELIVRVIDSTCENGGEPVAPEFPAVAGAGSEAAPSYYGEHRRRRERTATAVTDITLERELGRGLGYYALYPHTGFTHQLRVAMNELGAPICGDPLYPRVLLLEESAERPYPLQLLAASLDFEDPVTGESVHLESSQQLQLAH